MSQSSVCSNKAGGQALHGQLSEGLHHVDLYDCIYRIISSGIQNTEKYINKPLMSLILWFMIDQMDIMEGTDTMAELNRLETEQCGSTSVQLVQLPTLSNISGVSRIRNTGDSEDH